MSEDGGLTTRAEPLDGRTTDEFVALAGGSTVEELAGPDRGLEHSALYAVLFVLLVGGSMLLQSGADWFIESTSHTVMESVATILAFIVGALALVRYYSRKQATFLLIGCGFLGAAILDLNHVVGTLPAILDARVATDPRIEPDRLYAWTWTAGRAFLSLFLFVSLLSWQQEVKGSRDDAIPESTIYLIALVLTVSNLLFFDYVPLAAVSPIGSITRPSEFMPAAFFALAFIGYYRKGSWRRDQFEHWMLVSILISLLAHGAFMAFSAERYDPMFTAAHLLKIISHGAILTGLLSSVYSTFTREASVLAALTQSNDALAREVDFRSKTERAVKESSERLQSFLDNANDLIQSVDPDGRFLYVNSSWKRVLGYADADLERLKLFEIVHPQHRVSLEEELKRVLGGGDPRRFNTEYVASDGRLVILSGSSQVQRIGGESVATQSILRDVTEQRLAERRLDESQRNLEALVENTGDSIWSVDRAHRLITLNSAFSLAIEAQTGREPQAGELPQVVFAQKDVPWYEELYERTLSGERHVAVRTEEVDGHSRYFELYANPIHSLEGVSGAVFFGKDVTPRVRAEEALRVAKEEAEAANKAKSDFLANMSHELRTPLNSVIGFTNILLKNKGGRFEDKDLGFLQRVLSNGKHLLALINEVLDLAKVEAGRMELIIEEVDLAHLCVETVQQLEGQAKAKEGNIGLVADVPDDVELVETDSAKLKQVIINLVGNALKFTHAGSVTVRLEVASDGRTPIAIAVEDTGIGIPEDRLEAIFEAFQQAEAGTSRKYGGTGLGLALSRSICLLMGYDLMVESTMGQGSTFKIVMGARPGRAVPEAHPEDVAEAVERAAPPEVGVDIATLAPTGASGSDTVDDLAMLGDSLTLVPPVGGRAPESAAGGGPAPRTETVSTPETVPTPDTVPTSEALLTSEARSTSEAVSPSETTPVARPPHAARPLATMPGAPPSRPSWEDFKVLVVDDERDSRVLAAHFLEEFGCQVFTASGGEEGLELARQHRPHLVTLDLIMPEVTGWEVLRRMKNDPELRSIPVVVLSVVANEGRGKLLGAVDLVTKPFDREDLLRVLWRNLGRQRGGRVLILTEDVQTGDELGAVVERRDLEAVVVKRGALLAAIGQEAPDAVVLDLRVPNTNGVAELLRLRNDRVLTGLPVLVLTHDGLSDRERGAVSELATMHADRLQSCAALGRLLDVSFPLAQVQEADA